MYFYCINAYPELDKLDNYGFDKIEVRDNGKGIQISDVQYMARPHCTSKISTTEDLEKLTTYGFRGEALGSLCGVADVTITTGTAEDDVSKIYTLDQKGMITNSKPSHLGRGTTVTACNLFRHIPVRKQYYNNKKKKKEELKRVEDLVVAYSIVNHNVRFSLRHNKDLLYQSSSVNAVRDTLRCVLGTRLMSHLQFVEQKNTELNVEVEAYLPDLNTDCHVTSRSTNDRCFIYVNKRPVTLKEVEKILKQYYCHAVGCENNRHPIGYLHIKTASNQLDVNVDPNKTKVFLHNQEKTMQFLKDILEEVYGPLIKSSDKAEKQPITSVSENVISDVQLITEEAADSKPGIRSCDNSIAPRACDIVTPGASYGDNKTIIDKSDANITSGVLDETGPDLLTDESTLLDGLDFSSEMQIEECFISDSSSVSKTAAVDRTTTQSSALFNQNSSLNTLRNFSTEALMTSTPCLLPGSEYAGTSSNRSLEKVDGRDPEVLTDNDELTSPAALNNKSLLSPTTSQNNTMVITDSEVDKSNEKSNENIGYFDYANKKRLDVDNSEKDKDCNTVKDWSSGKAYSGDFMKPIEPVRLLAPNCLAQDTLLDTSKGSDQTYKTKVITESLNQSTLYDAFGTRPAKELSSGFRYFSKEVRPQVLVDNADASFQEIANTLEKKWESLSEQEHQKYESLANKYTHRNKDEAVKKHETSKLNKRRKLSQGQLQLWSPVRSKPKRPHRKSVDVSMSFERLKKSIVDGSISRQNGNRKFELIGKLKTGSLWLVIHDNQIKVFHPVRCQELLIYNSLMKDHAVALENLPSPLTICPTTFGIPSLWTTLLGLDKRQPDVPDAYVYYTDDRLVKNGFRLREIRECNDILKVEVVAMTTCMNYFGLSDLREILQVIESESNRVVHVCDCRPPKIKHYLQSEAVRMARKLPSKLDEDEAEDILQQIEENLPGSTTKCFHNRPFLEPLYDLEDLTSDPLTQPVSENEPSVS